MQKVFHPVAYLWLLLCLLLFCDSPGDAKGRGESGDMVKRTRMLQQIDSLIEREYVLPDKAPQYARSFRALWQSGAYDSIADPDRFAARVTADLRTITKDEHLLFRVVDSTAFGGTAQGPLHHPVRYYRLRLKENTGFTKLEWLEGNIGLLDLRRFNEFSEARKMVVGAMTFLENANAIIVDIRENGGGSGDYLSSYFLPYPTQLTGWYSRDDGFLTESWTSANIDSPPLTDVPVFILTSRRTFSAAESFAYDMKVQHRAILIGEPTRGGAHSVDLFNINGRFEIYIPTARATNPVTGGNWEGTGVIPDVAVPAAVAMDTALVLARRAADSYGAVKDERLKPAIRAMEVHMANAERWFRSHDPLAANTAVDSVFSIALHCGMLTEFFVDVLAYNFNSQADKEMLYAILKKKIEMFPRSTSAHAALAYAYFRNADFSRAIDMYEKVLVLEPGDRNALRMIQHIRKQQ